MSRNQDEIETNSTASLNIGSYVFDTNRKELRTLAGVVVPLRVQSAKILTILAQNPNQIVGKDELIKDVWAGRFVTDDSLVQCISDIRRVLGKPAHKILETFPKKGYRLNTGRTGLSERPAIAVLPFVNLSGDRDQEFFADGMSEDIITGLSRFRSLFVIARGSSFSYKNKSPDMRDVAQNLGVRYILKGSVRRSGNNIRITGQLVDAYKGENLWAEKYDRVLEDIFNIQDEITEKIVASIAPEIDFLERQRIRKRQPENLDIWGLYQRGLESHQSAMGDDCKSVVEIFDKVCELDPTFAPAFAMAASSRIRYALLFEPDNRTTLLDQALEKARMGISLDSRDSTCLWALGRVLTMLGRYEAAIASINDAISLNPNDSLAHYYLAMALGAAGRLEEAISEIDYALRLSPHDVSGGGFQTYKAFILFDLERYEEAAECALSAIHQPYPLSIPFEVLTAALVKLQRQDEARAALKDLLVHTPDTSLSRLDGRPWIGRATTKQRYLEALSEAGLPK